MHYPYDSLPDAGVALEIAERLCWVRMPLPFALDHVNLWLLADNDEKGSGWAAVDTGIALDAVKAHWLELLARYRLTRQIVTHCHPDHLGLAGWLEQQSGAGLWITQGEFVVAHLLRAGPDGYGYRAMMAFYARHGLDAARVAAFESRGNAFLRGVPTMPMSYRRLHDNDLLDIGGRRWRVIVGYGHSPEHAALYCQEIGVLISGDMLLPRITTNVHVGAATPDNDALQEYLGSLERFLSLPTDTLVLPSHGKPFRGLHERVEQLQRHHAQRCAALEAACAAQNRSAADLLPALFDRDISDPHQLQFAMGETIAHLNYLEHRQRIRRIDDGQILRYRALS
jgi:glyoxylase-like metal-dependent hydrolase (beta-lactamase superfamily II)